MKIYIIYELFLCLLVVTFCPPGGFMLTVPSHNLHCYPHHQISSYEQFPVRTSPGTCCPWAHSPSKYVNILNLLGQHASSPSGVLWSSFLNHQPWSSSLDHQPFKMLLPFTMVGSWGLIPFNTSYFMGIVILIVLCFMINFFMSPPVRLLLNPLVWRLTDLPVIC